MSPFYLVFDAACLLGVLVASYRHLSLLHPLAAYIFFHAYSFTMRAWEIYMGAPTMYSIGYSSGYEAITIAEVTRALFFADLALLAFALGIMLARKGVERAAAAGKLAFWKPILRAPTLAILYGTIIIGSVFFVLIRARQTNLDFGALGNYVGVTTMWPITGLIALYFIYGRFWPVAIPSVVYLSVVSLQGYHRFMFVLPIISLVGVFLYYRRKKWPPFQIWAIIVAIMLVFPVLKSVGRSFGDGDYKAAVEQLTASFSGKSDVPLADDASGFLDQYAGFLTLSDQHGRFEYGKTYLSIITLPIPRGWWPGKPGLADHIIERSTPSRPHDREGRIITYIGQAYVNFGALGVLLVPLALAYALGVFYERFIRLPPTSLAALTYIFIASTFIQAYRDGLNSVLLFGFVYNMPLMFIWLIHSSVPKRPFTTNMQRPLR